MLSSEPELDFGPCCACGQSGPTVRNVLLLDRRGPMPGRGWGCFQCGLPMDGASAVLCDACLEANAEIKFARTGYPAEDGRTPIEALPAGEFKHNLAFHPEAAYDPA